MLISSAQGTRLSETAAISSGSVAFAFRHLFLPPCSCLVTAGSLRLVPSNVSTAGSMSTMGAGGEGYRALCRSGTTTTNTAAAMARCSLEARCREGCRRSSTLDDDDGTSKQTLTMMIKGCRRSSTLDDDDGTSKQTLTMMINRSRTGTRCHINLEHVCQAGRVALRACDGGI